MSGRLNKPVAIALRDLKSAKPALVGVARIRAILGEPSRRERQLAALQLMLDSDEQPSEAAES